MSPYLTPDEWEILKRSQIYNRYNKTAFSSLTLASIQTDLDAILRVDEETIPLIKFLMWLKQSTFNETYTWDQQYSLINNIRTYDLQLYYASQAETGRAANNEYGLHEGVYSVEQNDHTLAGGALANALMYTGVASNQIGVGWIALTWDTDPAAAYVLDFQQEDSATSLWKLAWTPTEIGQRKLLAIDCSGDDKNLEADISGGAGAEVLTTQVNGVYFT